MPLSNNEIEAIQEFERIGAMESQKRGDEREAQMGNPHFQAEDTKCYYDNNWCNGELWQCQTCEEYFCYFHLHITSKGVCVECVACERARKEAGNAPR